MMKRQYSKQYFKFGLQSDILCYCVRCSQTQAYTACHFTSLKSVEQHIVIDIRSKFGADR